MKPQGDGAIRLRIFCLLILVSVVPLLTLYWSASNWALYGALILSFALSAIVTTAIYPSLFPAKSEIQPGVTSKEALEPGAPTEWFPTHPQSSSELSRLRHDLLNPMSAAMGFLELMQRNGNLSDSQQRYVSNISKSMERVVAVANTLPSSRSVTP